MQLTELQLYINKTATFLGKVDLIYTRRQDHQCNNLIMSDTIFTSQLSKNHNNIQQDYDMQTKP